MNIVQDFIPAGAKNRPGYRMDPRFITVHNTANPNVGAANHARYLKSGNAGSTSWHFTVDDQFIYQHLPTNEVGWHAGDGSSGPGNRQSIGIEICEFDDKAKQDRAVSNAIWLIRKLMKEHGIPLSNVVPHKKWTGKHCPRVLLANWDEFIAKVGSGTDVATKWSGQTLKEGREGPWVRDLQVMLLAAGHDPGVIDGVFGPKTFRAVKAFQQSVGLVVDGIAGPATFAALKKAIQQEPETKTEPAPGQLYRIMTGTFATREDAEKRAAEIREKIGIVVYVVEA